MTWRDRLRQAVEESGKTQARIALDAGVPEETVSRLMTGATKNPQIDTLLKIAHHGLGVTVAWLLGERGHELSPRQRERLKEAAEIMDTLTREQRPKS